MIRELVIARDRDRERSDREIREAWWTVRLYGEWRTKKLPALTSLLERAEAGPRRQTDEEQRRMLETFSRLYGGAVRPASGQ